MKFMGKAWKGIALIHGKTAMAAGAGLTWICAIFLHTAAVREDFAGREIARFVKRERAGAAILHNVLM
jgi:hypothetical protein